MAIAAAVAAAVCSPLIGFDQIASVADDQVVWSDSSCVCVCVWSGGGRRATADRRAAGSNQHIILFFVARPLARSLNANHRANPRNLAYLFEGARRRRHQCRCRLSIGDDLASLRIPPLLLLYGSLLCLIPELNDFEFVLGKERARASSQPILTSILASLPASWI